MLKNFIEVAQPPEALEKELSGGPFSNLLSHYIMKPIHFEADPYFYPKQSPYKPNPNAYNKGGNYNKNKFHQNNEVEKGEDFKINRGPKDTA